VRTASKKKEPSIWKRPLFIKEQRSKGAIHQHTRARSGVFLTAKLFIGRGRLPKTKANANGFVFYRYRALAAAHQNEA
jgi:hypothetical protein